MLICHLICKRYTSINILITIVHTVVLLAWHMKSVISFCILKHTQNW